MKENPVMWKPSPEEFWESFKEVMVRHPPHGSNAESGIWTGWFEDRMIQLAKKKKIHCQNRSSKESNEEWMKVDHVFVENLSYTSFPLVAVEHENGGVGGKNGELPEDPHQKAPIEWAFWKCLSMKCHLSVLVAYPYEEDNENVLSELNQMLTGWKNIYNETPNCLVLLGCWKNGKPYYEKEIYKAYQCIDMDDEFKLNIITT